MTDADLAMRERFEELFHRHSRPLLAYALRRVDRPQDAADVLSEVMLIAWRRLADVPLEPEARLWLFGVARGVLANQQRSERRRTRLGERLRHEVERSVSRDHAEIHEVQETVRAALRELSDDDRELLTLTAWEGLEPAELATVLSVPAATIRTRLHRARARLRQQLETTGWSERNGRPGHVSSDGHQLVDHVEEER